MSTAHAALPTLVLLATGLAACAASAPGESRSVSIMTFNVENLFDTRHDPGKDDYTFLPRAAKQSAAHRARCASIEVERWREQCLDWDWSEQLLDRKLDVLARSILQVGDGRGPDILALQEVENRAIVERLRRNYLGAAGYRETVLIEGDDLRGIDVAFLTRLPIHGRPSLHDIEFADEFATRTGDTRGILEATFELPDGRLLTGFAVHFPAPFHPAPMRVSAYRRLENLLAALPPERPAFAAGDFNTTSSEDAAQDLLGRFARPHWVVAHETGCGAACRGSAYYARDDSWSFLDMLLWSPARRGADATWALRSGSVRLVNDLPEQRLADGTPARFEAEGGRGVSDHWPLIMHIFPLQSNK